MEIDENRTRLYFSLPANMLAQAEETARLFEGMAATLDIACVALELPDTLPVDDQALDRLIGVLQHQNIAVVAVLDPVPLFGKGPELDKSALNKQLERIVKFGLDGLHMGADEAVFDAARDYLPQDAIIGAFCGSSKHQAMQLAERGADYIAFARGVVKTNDDEEEDGPVDPLFDLVDWWQELFEVPCIAWGLETREEIEALVSLPADFIAPLPSLLNDEAGVTWLAGLCGHMDEVA